MTQLVLNREQESRLKQELLKIVVQNEVDPFMADPKTVEHSVFLKFVRDMFMNFPLLDNREKAREKLTELFANLPKILTMTQKATKHDLENRKLRMIVVKFLEMAVRTPEERKWDQRFFDESFVATPDLKGINNEQDKLRKTTLTQVGQELSHVCQRIFFDLEQDHGVDRFFAVLRNSTTETQLPPAYREFLRLWGKMMSVEMEKQYSDPKHVSSLKRMEKVAPIHAIKGLLAITDPLKLLQGIVHLVIARPFNTHSVLQKWAAAATELKRSKATLKEDKDRLCHVALRWLSHHDRTAIQHWLGEYVAHSALPIPEEDVYVVGAETEFSKVVPDSFVMDLMHQCPEFEHGDVQKLSADDFSAIKHVLISELRVKEKSEFVEMMGTPQMTEIFREIIPIFYAPFSILFCRSDIGSHFKNITGVVHSLVKVSEDTEHQDVHHRQIAYQAVMVQLMDCLFQFVHSAALGDTGQNIQSTIQWYIDFLRFIHRREVLDMRGLVATLSPADQTACIAEINASIEHHKLCAEGTPPKDRVPLVVIPKLAPAFHSMLAKRLAPPQDDFRISDDAVSPPFPARGPASPLPVRVPLSPVPAHPNFA